MQPVGVVLMLCYSKKNWRVPDQVDNGEIDDESGAESFLNGCINSLKRCFLTQ